MDWYDSCSSSNRILGSMASAERQGSLMVLEDTTLRGISMCSNLKRERER